LSPASPVGDAASGPGGSAMGDSHPAVRARLLWLRASAAVFVLYLHGSGSLMLVAVCVGLWAVGKRRDARLTWAAALLALTVNELGTEWLRWGSLVPPLAFLDSLPLLGGGEYAWHSAFNLVLLRVISFNQDYAEAWRHAHAHSTGVVGGDGLVVVDERNCPAWSYEWRVRQPQPLRRFSLANYLAYLFYVPLVIAGPTLPFNAFASQAYTPAPVDWPFVRRYAARWLAALLLLEATTSYFPLFSFANTTHLYSTFTPFEVGVAGYWALNCIWLKFLVLWRLFRLAALADGVEVVENMNRCMTNSVSLEGFWRSWHRSFNRWLIRYIYIPMGGSRARGVPQWAPRAVKEWGTTSSVGRAVVPVVRHVASIFTVFTFVALWHEMNAKLLAWGWLFGLAFVPEVLANRSLRSGILSKQRRKWWFLYLRAAGVMTNIMALVIINLVGFSVGLAGMSRMLGQVWSAGGGGGLVGHAMFYYSLSIVLITVRDLERAGGRDVKT